MIKILKWIFWFGKQKTISKSDTRIFLSFVQKTQQLSPKQQVIEFDKIYHHILKKMWYEWTFWEILKQEPKEVKNIQNIWELHKFRNTLVHELRDQDERFILKQAESYRKIIEIFLKQITQK